MNLERRGKDMEKKIRVTLPHQVLDVINSDAEEFGITRNYLCNYIFEKMREEKLDKEVPYDGDKDTIQFNLNNKNKRDYYDFLREMNIQVEAEFFRKLFYKYSNQPKKKRELFIFQDVVERLQHGIKDKKIIKVTFKDSRAINVTPYYLGSSKLEIANYLFCYDMEERKYRNYSLKNIGGIYITKEKGYLGDIEFIERVKKDFDPFLSQGQKVKIKLTESGERLLRELKTNRPQMISKDGKHYEFQCSEEKAKRYFTYFLDEAEIIEPFSLREWFKNKYKNALKNYEVE